MTWEPTLTNYLILAAADFSLGLFGVMIQRNAITLFMCIELMLNSVHLTFIGFSEYRVDFDGQIFAFFVIAVAAAEAALGLAAIILLFRPTRRVIVDQAHGLLSRTPGCGRRAC